ncbi:TetR family transcriptional regulator [Hydrogenoanaerobacterium saccharovorans]|uniref:Transcriptional regulator, TetR family n=1 Tax=Hydrogenoanaerobacterium saccharovorans TaxID=474960 RepID=A0A1H7ZB73_9FIRM|nr:TetR/AcrR family transcriptional regulator [Hydrogenoanaerobacterium saccharovorans]RPF48762.1 TetR family transcriptional regulator [Hydrogenoanaerobacterium saccharovorans]SEM54747.1 transcriptional regulator, TetR family [Hydrogenoanaerobacterium saccharovorans]
MKENPKKNQKRQELILTIVEVVNRLGYENLTIRDICREANISIGTFYHYFNEKSDIVRILFKGIDDYFENSVLPSFGNDELKNILTFVCEYASYCDKSGVAITREISTAPLINASRNYLSNQKRKLSIIIEGVVFRGQQKKQITQDFTVEQIAQMVLVGMRGYSADWAKNQGAYDIVEAVKNHFIVFNKGISA